MCVRVYVCMCVCVSVTVHYNFLSWFCVLLSVCGARSQNVLQQRESRVVDVVTALTQYVQFLVQTQRPQHVTHADTHTVAALARAFHPNLATSPMSAVRLFDPIKPLHPRYFADLPAPAASRQFTGHLGDCCRGRRSIRGRQRADSFSECNQELTGLQTHGSIAVHQTTQQRRDHSLRDQVT